MEKQVNKLKKKFSRWPQIVRPDFNPPLPRDPSSLATSQVSTLLFQFTELYRWAIQNTANKRAECKLLKAALNNEIRLNKVSMTKKVSLAQIERETKTAHQEFVEKIDFLEAEIAALEGLCESFKAAREALSREITIRTND